MFSLYFYQLNKSSSDLNKLQFLVFIAFLESLPTFMEIGFVYVYARISIVTLVVYSLIRSHHFQSLFILKESGIFWVLFFTFKKQVKKLKISLKTGENHIKIMQISIIQLLF